MEHRPETERGVGHGSATDTDEGLAARLCRDLYPHKAPIYFADSGASAAVGYFSTWRYLTAEALSPTQAAWLVIAALALFRAGVFIHEIAHMPKGRMRAFKMVWNLCFGIPMLMPSFMYKNHADHHSRRAFGTAQDGEYQPFASGSRLKVIVYFLQVPIIPLFGVLRFALMTPLSLLSSKLRLWVLAHMSSYISNPAYVRRLPEEDRSWWLPAELASMAFIYGVAGAVISDWLPWQIVPQLYILSTIGVALNWVRNLAGHRFRSDGRPMSFPDQIAESINITGSPWLNEWQFPVGMRYHALHHMLPGLPYHNMREAHRRLLQHLPTNAPYRHCGYPNLAAVYRELFSAIRTHAKRMDRPA